MSSLATTPFGIEWQARWLLDRHGWDLDALHRKVIADELAQALMRDDHAAYHRWHAIYSAAVQLAAGGDRLEALWARASDPSALRRE